LQAEALCPCQQESGGFFSVQGAEKVSAVRLEMRGFNMLASLFANQFPRDSARYVPTTVENWMPFG
jgi:hypothetical protein